MNDVPSRKGPTLGEVGLAMMAIKRQVAELEEKVKAKKLLIERAENIIMALLRASGQRLAQVDDPEHDAKYTFSLSGGVRFQMVDQPAFHEYVVRTGDLGMFTKALNKEAVEEYIKSNSNALPPGVRANPYDDLSVRTTRVPKEGD
jgi:hypothetical protein